MKPILYNRAAPNIICRSALINIIRKSINLALVKFIFIGPIFVKTLFSPKRPRKKAVFVSKRRSPRKLFINEMLAMHLTLRSNNCIVAHACVYLRYANNTKLQIRAIKLDSFIIEFRRIQRNNVFVDKHVLFLVIRRNTRPASFYRTGINPLVRAIMIKGIHEIIMTRPRRVGSIICFARSRPPFINLSEPTGKLIL